MPTKRKPRRRQSRAVVTQPSSPTTTHTSPPRSVTREPSSTPRLLTIDEVADLLRTSRKAIYTKIRRGALPGVVRLPRRLLVDREHLLEWIDNLRAVSLPTQGEQR